MIIKFLTTASIVFRLATNCSNVIPDVFCAAKAVGALSNGYWASGVGSQSQTRYAQISCFFLDTAGIRDEQPAAENQVRKLDITDGFIKINFL